MRNPPMYWYHIPGVQVEIDRPGRFRRCPEGLPRDHETSWLARRFDALGIFPSLGGQGGGRRLASLMMDSLP